MKPFLLMGAVCLATSMTSQSVWADLDFSGHTPLTCEAFIANAVSRDPNFTQALQTYLTAKYARLSATAVADWTLGLSAGYSFGESVTENVFEPRSRDSLVYQLSVERLFLTTGSRLSLRHQNTLSSFVYLSDPALDPVISAFDLPREASSPEVTVSLIQPLLRNAFGLADRYPVEAADVQVQSAANDVREAWENRISELFATYLSWAQSYENVQALQSTLADLRRLQEQVARKVAAGVAERTDLLRAKDNVLRTEGQVAQAEGNFLSESAAVELLWSGDTRSPSAGFLRIPDLAGALGECQWDADAPSAPTDDLRLIRNLKLLQTQQTLNLNVARNALLPRLDVLGDYTIKGRTEDLSGGYQDLNRHDAQLVLQASLPLGAVQARAQVGQAEAALEDINASLEAARQSLATTQFRLATTIRKTRERLERQVAQVENAREKLALDRRNFNIGRLDTFYVIDANNALTNARLAKVQTDIELRRLWVERLALEDRLLDRFPDLRRRLDEAREVGR